MSTFDLLLSDRRAGPPQARPDQGPRRGPFVAPGGSLDVPGERGVVISTFELSVRFLLQLAAILAVGKVLALFGHDADTAWRAIGAGLLCALLALLVVRRLLAATLGMHDGTSLTQLL